MFVPKKRKKSVNRTLEVSFFYFLSDLLMIIIRLITISHLNGPLVKKWVIELDPFTIFSLINFPVSFLICMVS